MNLLGSDSFWSSVTSSTSQDDLLELEILLTHNPEIPDGRSLDTELLLSMVENIIRHTSSPQVDVTAMHSLSNTEIQGLKESFGQIIYRISLEILCKCSEEGNIHSRTMSLFDSLSNYEWDVKVVLLLAAFATTYAESWLLLRLYSQNPLAESIAMLKSLPSNVNSLKSQFTSLNLLIKTMVDTAKCIMEFESLPLLYVELDRELISSTKSQMYKAAYWVARSILVCSLQIRDLMGKKPEHVYAISKIAVWQLSSLTFRLNSMCSTLRQKLDMCHRQTETLVYQKLLNLSDMTHTDNQEVLNILFFSKYGLPLKHCPSQAKIEVAELINKVVILLITTPELLPLNSLQSLIQQTYYHPYDKNVEGRYAIVWIPIPLSGRWTDAEEKTFDIFSNNIPWFTIRHPRLLNKAVVNFIKQEWNYKDEAVMVVLDPQGTVTNSNALDMVLIWGPQSFPFSSSREKELWKEENLSLHLLTDGIDPQLALWLEEERNLCIYGSYNLDWIEKVYSKARESRMYGLELEMLYVGTSKISENLRTILATIDERKQSHVLPFPKIYLFWLRLKSMRRSKLKLGETRSSDHTLALVSALLDFNYADDGWAIIGKGPDSDIVSIQGNQVMELLNSYARWGETVAELGFLGAIKAATEPRLVVGPCNHAVVVPYDEHLTEGTKVCDKCKLPMKKYIVYE